jgi:cleavage and polyadenylation specificity factor subunit 3
LNFLLSSFHLDHCGALPWFLSKTNFKGRCFMTHATKAIYKWLLSDCIRVRYSEQIFALIIFIVLFHSNVSSDEMLYTEAELIASMPRIETINFHQVCHFKRSFS